MIFIRHQMTVWQQTRTHTRTDLRQNV